MIWILAVVVLLLLGAVVTLWQNLNRLLDDYLDLVQRVRDLELNDLRRPQ